MGWGGGGLGRVFGNRKRGHHNHGPSLCCYSSSMDFIARSMARFLRCAAHESITFRPLARSREYFPPISSVAALFVSSKPQTPRLQTLHDVIYRLPLGLEAR